ncbi:MAG: acylphosphatase [Acidimicrobiales bacterium]|nr:acylphosphatase [Acidimicrobiales bacterium]
MVIRRHVIVSGRVQGVWFRDSCRQRAEELGVAGWISNRPDGRVEAVFEGSPDAVDAMVDWSRRGPRRARVDDVEIADEPPDGLDGFSVRSSR